MRKCLVAIAAAVLWAASAAPSFALQCVVYARQVSGLNLRGDAWQWWNAASGIYERGNTPRQGSVLVFPRQGSMRFGHVSVVAKVVSSRLILVDHANWAPPGSAGRGKITESVPVIDVSPKNDWTQVRVWYRPSNDFGSRTYQTQGFVYAPASERKAAPAKDTPVKVIQAALEKAPPSVAATLKAFRDKTAPEAKTTVATAAEAKEATRTGAAPAEAAKTAEAKPAADEAAAPVQVAKAEPLPSETAGNDIESWARQAGQVSADQDLVRVAKHIFRPHRAAATGSLPDEVLYN